MLYKYKQKNIDVCTLIHICVCVDITLYGGVGWIHQWTHTSPELFWAEGFLLMYSQTQSLNLCLLPSVPESCVIRATWPFKSSGKQSMKLLKPWMFGFPCCLPLQSWYCLFAFSLFSFNISFNNFKLTKYELLVFTGFYILIFPVHWFQPLTFYYFL